jgi:dinuclear metal center YbgI/SA1388 family protein
LNKFDLVKRIEQFAPLETQEDWDNSGWLVCTDNKNITKIMLALTITDDIYNQAKKNNCDMIISHHPLFFIPLKYSDVNMYCAHTNVDKAIGGTTDTLIEELGFKVLKIEDEYIRIVKLKNRISTKNLTLKLREISPNLRYVNNSNITSIKTIGFCSGSGSEFIDKVNTDAFITGDLKFHLATESTKLIYDIGHFESEIHILKKFANILDCPVIYAKESSPFIY